MRPFCLRADDLIVECVASLLYCVSLPYQVLLINAVKDVASALGELISATKCASGKSPHDPSMTTLKDSAKVGAGGGRTYERHIQLQNVQLHATPPPPSSSTTSSLSVPPPPPPPPPPRQQHSDTEAAGSVGLGVASGRSMSVGGAECQQGGGTA